MNFDIQNFGSIKIGSLELWITQTHIATWFVMGILICFAVVVRIKMNKFKDVPKGLQNVVELMVETFNNFLKDSAGEKFFFLGSWFFTVFAVVLLSNIIGIVPIIALRAPTADWSFTVTLAMVTFLLIHIIGVRYRGFGYVKSMFEPFLFGKIPNLILFPLNLVGELARPISLSFRMFGNVLSGTILMGLFYGMVPVFLRFFIPSFLHAYFDLFSGVLQTYVFTVLSLSFISAAAATEE
ncbi:MAG: F0F1 ATP synthase subunit A [Oscillospiraceae bacterium]|nr:F0F1 ATP synthase subunit A [Oscillospiraceae bacterium]